jgi:hypothetical protein
MWYFQNLSPSEKQQVVVHLICSKKTSENKRPYQLPVWGRIKDERPVADASCEIRLFARAFGCWREQKSLEACNSNDPKPKKGSK